MGAYEVGYAKGTCCCRRRLFDNAVTVHLDIPLLIGVHGRRVWNQVWLREGGLSGTKCWTIGMLIAYAICESIDCLDSRLTLIVGDPIMYIRNLFP